ncbi:hypothetical protein MRX96_007929 [Rhipicephalus microplus]
MLCRYDLPRYGSTRKGTSAWNHSKPKTCLRNCSCVNPILLRAQPPPNNDARSHNRLMAALVCAVALASVTTASAAVVMTLRNEIFAIEFGTAKDDSTQEYFVKSDTGDPSNASYDVTSPIYSVEFNESFALSQTMTEPTDSVRDE